MSAKGMLVVLLVLVVIAAAGDLVFPHSHPVFPWHHLPGFQAALGLAGAAAFVFVPKALARLLQSPEEPE